MHPGAVARLGVLACLAGAVAGEGSSSNSTSSSSLEERLYFTAPRPHDTLAMLGALAATRQPSAATVARYGPEALPAAQALVSQLLAMEALPTLLRDTNVLASLYNSPPAQPPHAHSDYQPPAPVSASPGGAGPPEPAASDATTPSKLQDLRPTTAGAAPPGSTLCLNPPAQLVATAAPATLTFTAHDGTVGGECGWRVRCAGPTAHNESVLLLNFTLLTLANHLRMVAGDGSPR